MKVTAVNLDITLEIRHADDVPTGMLADFVGFLAADCDELLTSGKLDDYIEIMQEMDDETADRFADEAAEFKAQLLEIERLGSSTYGEAVRSEPIKTVEDSP